METPAASGLAVAHARPETHPSDELLAEPEALLSTQPGQRVRVYVWEIPVRITHWLTVLWVVVLTITGGYIADPFLLPETGATMGIMRFIHMLAAYAFVATGVVRVYWLFRGNRFAQWRAFVPTNRRHLNELAAQTGWYLFVRRELPGVLGHNALAAAAYSIVFFLFLVQILTGFALEAQHGDALVMSLFGWIAGVFGIEMVRVVHHLVMWAILGFVVHHVYAAVLVDHAEKSGLISSMFSGFKFATRREVARARDGGIELEETLR